MCQFIIIIGIISMRVALQALYQRGRLVELDVQQDPDSTQTRPRGQIMGNRRGDKTDPRKIARVAGIVKDSEDKRDHVRIPDTFT